MTYEEYGKLGTKLNLSGENKNNHLIMVSFCRKTGSKTVFFLIFWIN